MIRLKWMIRVEANASRKNFLAPLLRGFVFIAILLQEG
jgi:hypothetical protein